ncbi:MAG: right-handed parallel beta-helix repeat-containing protein [Phaeodactylibacter sp.]|nr:right-handed parallel beta-helix repeat-containing protein [Phaeodactylibacter sp.]MCB9275601.1 right-handed parallel beta-helix repeat-containing protein [Lewinellaceae bacterium]
MAINTSTIIKPGDYNLNGADSLDQPLIVIEGSDITVDFNGAQIRGSNDKQWPDEYYGLAVLVRNGRNITIRNLKARGYKVALMAEGVDSLTLENCDLSYNYRQHLKSIREREDLSDWLSYHDNEQDQWLRYGAAVYLKACKNAVVRGLTVTGGQNGLMLTRCDSGLFYNNTIHFNSGVGIGLYRSGHNRVMHNRLDWNVRGYSQGFYSRGQDSAGILCYEQSSNNTFAYNSATHSGDGFFLWAGQSSMDTGEGGCNDNIIFGNDFSHAPTNGIEVTFSRNIIARNRLEECQYGLWGGYSFESLITGNTITGCSYGIAVEHGQQNAVINNFFGNDTIGIQLWERATQPSDWGYAQAKDVSSRDYEIQHNAFHNVGTPLKVSGTANVAVNDDNQFYGFKKLLQADQPNERLLIVKNDIYQEGPFGDASGVKAMNRIVQPPSEDELQRWPGEITGLAPVDSFEPEPLPDGMDAMLSEAHPRGRKFILVGEWGPYDFQRPGIWLREVKGDTYTFLLLGPHGNWSINDGAGFTGVNPKTGTFPATVVAHRDTAATELRLELEFIGEPVVTEFGEQLSKGTPVHFDFYRYEKPLNWQVRFYNYNETTNPLTDYNAFRALKDQPPVAEKQTQELAFAWWREPAPGVGPDHFATFASTSFEITPGRYRITITSDDGLRCYLDGKRIIDHWDIHVPDTDEAVVELGGKHTLEVEHFEGGGFATLSFRMEPER